jgi:ribosomal protein S18 acetylase RimI-like enzyme
MERDPPGPAALAESADANFFVHAAWVAMRMPGMRAEDGDDLALVDSELPCDTFNFVLRARLPPERTSARVREAIGHFRSVGRPFSWWVGPADRPANLGGILEAEGLGRSESEVAMTANLGELRDAPANPGGLKIRRARTEGELRDFARVNAANWSPPDPHVLRYFEEAAPLLLGPGSPLSFYVGYLGGEAVAAAELTEGGGVAGLYNVSTLESHRRRGFGAAMTLAPLLDARARGLGIAVLQASADGAGVYARLGFRPFGSIVEFKP